MTSTSIQQRLCGLGGVPPSPKLRPAVTAPFITMEK